VGVDGSFSVRGASSGLDPAASSEERMTKTGGFWHAAHACVKFRVPSSLVSSSGRRGVVQRILHVQPHS